MVKNKFLSLFFFVPWKFIENARHKFNNKSWVRGWKVKTICWWILPPIQLTEKWNMCVKSNPPYFFFFHFFHFFSTIFLKKAKKNFVSNFFYIFYCYFAFLLGNFLIDDTRSAYVWEPCSIAGTRFSHHSLNSKLWAPTKI